MVKYAPVGQKSEETTQEHLVAEYRWNISQFAAGFDVAAEHIHPY